MKLNLLTLLMSVSVCLAGAPDSTPAQVLKVAEACWETMWIQDMDNLKPFVRETDIEHIPQQSKAQNELRGLEVLKPLREDIRRATSEAFVLDHPQIAEDQRHATVRVSLNQDKLLRFLELFRVYQQYMAAAYMAKQTQREPPSLDAVRSWVLAKDSSDRKTIEMQAEETAKQKMPTIHLEFTGHEWRVNLQQLLEDSKPGTK